MKRLAEPSRNPRYHLSRSERPLSGDKLVAELGVQSRLSTFYRFLKSRTGVPPPIVLRSFLGRIGSGPKSQNTPVYKKTHATLPAPYRPKPQQNPVVARCTAKRKIFLPFLRFVFWSVNLRCGRCRRQRTHSHRYLCHYRPIFIPIIRATEEAQ